MDTVFRHIKKGGLVGILVSPLKSIISLKGKIKKILPYIERFVKMRRKNKFNSTNGKENICLYRNYQLMDIDIDVKNLKYHLIKD